MLRAMTADMESFDGEAVTATVSADAFTGVYTVAYRRGAEPVGTRTFTVDQRLRRVSQLTFELDKYERRRGYETMLAVHERLLDNLAGTGASLTAIVSPDDSRAWAGAYDWAVARAEHNAAAVAAAVAAVYAAVADQSVWPADGLPARVQAIAGARAPDPEDRLDGWSRLIGRVTPAELVEGLDEIQPGLGRAVFAQMPEWYGQSHVA